MNKIIKRISGLIIVLVLITIFGIYTYRESDGSIYTSSTPLSRIKNMLGNKKGRQS